jgi:hypothetical protein
MKILKSLVLVVLVAVAFTSCNKDETTLPAPVITFQNGTTSLVFNGTNSIDINVTIAAEGKIESVTLNGPSLTGTGTTTTTITSKMGTSGNENSNGQTSATYLFKVSPTDLTAAFINHTTLTYTFTITDQQSTTTTGSFTVTMQSSGTPFAYENLNGVIWNIIGANPGSWDLVSNASVIATGSETSKDMKNTTTVTTGWSNEWTAGTNNNTLFVKANTFNYATGTSEAAATAYASGTPNAKVTGPVANDIYIAKLRGGANYAVIKIISVVETTSDNLDKITFSYKKVAQTSGK